MPLFRREDLVLTLSCPSIYLLTTPDGGRVVVNANCVMQKREDAMLRAEESNADRF